MNKMLSLSGALVLALGLSQASLAQGRGPDKDHGDKHAGKEDGHPGKGKGGPGKDGKDNRGEGRNEARNDGKGRGPDRVVVHDVDRTVVVAPRQTVRVVVRPQRVREVRIIGGCPPGLAKRHNGCLPPGQAKKLERLRFDRVFAVPKDDFVWRYDDGYLYRLDRKGTLLGYVPALGGALAVGNPWPVRYVYEPVPVYQASYFGLPDARDYRYADGALYGVDPKTEAISSVVALLNGQPLNVGQTMPAGYDVYNVPYANRGQYVDSADRAYRYADGYVYQVDPTTQLVQAVIQLLT